MEKMRGRRVRGRRCRADSLAFHAPELRWRDRIGNSQLDPGTGILGRLTMTSRTLIALIVLAAALALEPFLRPHVSHAPVYSFPVTLANGTHTPLSALIGGKVALLVNVASNCGLTPQYSGLERLYREKKDAGFEIVAFPCNQFGGQEPGSIDEIQNFCSKKFDVTFQLTEKVEVNGENADPLWKHLKSARPGVAGTKEIEWNFAKVCPLYFCCSLWNEANRAASLSAVAPGISS